MGLADKLIERLVEQAETLAKYRQLAEGRRDEMCDLKSKLRETQQELQRLQKVHLESQSEEVAAAIAVIETLRQERDLARVEIMTFRVSDDSLRKDRDHWKQARQDAIEAGELMKAEIETLRQQFGNAQRELSEQGLSHSVELQQETADLRQQLDAARTEAVTLRTRNDALLEKYKPLRSDHARLGHLVEERGQEMERLLAFVGKARKAISRAMNYCDVEFLFSALAELDAGTAEPALVTEPLDAEGGA